MIKHMHPTMRAMLMPVKKKADGGVMDWDKIMDSINGPDNTPAPTTVAPTTTAPNTSSINPVGMQPSSVNLPAPTSPSLTSSKVLSGLGTIGSSLAPFASNVVNAMRTPPQPALPHMDNLVSLRASSYANDRAEASREINASSAFADRTVDGNTAAKIRLFNTGQKLDRFSAINQQEHNAQISVGNDQARINAGISARNSEKLDTYGNQQVERKIAEQREQSANLSNASDKFVQMQNESEKRRVDLEKTKTMATLFSKSGVADRERKALQDSGVPDPLGRNYEDLKRNGGYMRVGGSMGSFYRNIPLRSQTLKSLYKAPN